MTRPHWALALLLAIAVSAMGQEDDDPRPKFQPGLVGQYTGPDGKPHERIDERLSFVWNTRRPDPRLPAGDFTAGWQGRLFSIVSGEYRLHVFAAGEVAVRLQDKLILEGKSNEPKWLSSQPIKLNYGHHPLNVRFKKTSDHARISLYWQGPRFPLEPVPARRLFHDPPQSPSGQFEQGQRLTRALRCAACHRIPGHERPIPAPALTHLSDNIDRTWLVDWIQHTGKEAGRLNRMPHFGLERTDAEAIAAYLLSKSAKTPREPPAKNPPKRSKKKRKPSAKIGRELFVTLGCLACHKLGDLGGDGPFGGGDLSRIAEKRPPEFFSRWLSDPAKINRDHRMPVFRLGRQQHLDLGKFLSTLGKAKAESPPKAAADVARGGELIVRHRCHACHRMPEDLPAAIAENERWLLHADRRWDASCLGDSDLEKRRPGYRLSKAHRAGIQQYIAHLAEPPKDVPNGIDGRMVLAERNCLACHTRGVHAGIEARLPAVVEAHPDLTQHLPAMKPPALFGVGEKFHEQALVDAITTKQGVLRPWLKIRMPRFDLSKEERQALITHFVDTDRIPPLPKVLQTKPAANQHDATALQIAGSRLVTSGGFGCASCHQIGSAMAEKDEIRSRGPNLAMLGRRVRREWYDRFLPDPPRMVPNMEMPSLASPVRGVLGDDLDAQLAAVWHVLNQPDFSPPQPGAVRIVRCRNVPDKPEPANVLTDVLEVGKKVYIKPLLIGLPNRHNILFDLGTNQLAGWWIGDTARQRTRGKTWYWEPAGTHLFAPNQGESELKRIRGEKLLAPLLSGQFPTEFDWFEHVSGGIRFGQRVRFKPNDGNDPLVIHVTQTFTATPKSEKGGAARSGFRRRVEIRPVPLDFEFVLRLLPNGAVKDAPEIRLPRQKAPSPVPTSARTGRFEVQPRVVDVNGKRSAVIDVDYFTPLPVDRFPIVISPPPRPAAEELQVAPGFEAVALPIRDEVMPTALAWRKDGTLIVAGLKGRVWLGQDTNEDGLEDKLVAFSQDLAAPYGLNVHNGAIDVLTKYALLRLHDGDDDGRADRTVTVASGWGHTRDYHDWAVGLPKDREGNYYMALPCQQDKRSQAAAALRGKALKLVPRKPTGDDPRAYEIEEICGGLRFPMGLASNRKGALFATDNQGNYNPFNELNHLQPGRRYGFINKLEFRPGFKPPLTPPAIDIPHPWTRSVNGIAFLDTPEAVREKLGRDLFGPFEGHLLGCEYDTRRLIRMSLHKVGDSYQGAAYPFTIDPPKDSPRLQGPICCAVAPDGDVYIGNMRDSGWGGGSNVGSLVRLRPQGKLPAGIAEVRATADGFTIDFTAPVDRRLASQPGSYTVSSYRRISTPAYGGKDQDRRTESVGSAAVSPDARRVSLKVGKLRAGFVYEFRLKNLAGDTEPFHPAEAHYTLRRIPGR